MFISYCMTIELTLFYKILVLANLSNKEQTVPMFMDQMHLLNRMINSKTTVKIKCG